MSDTECKSCGGYGVVFSGDFQLRGSGRGSPCNSCRHEAKARVRRLRDDARTESMIYFARARRAFMDANPEEGEKFGRLGITWERIVDSYNAILTE